MKLTKKQIDVIIAHTPEELKNKPVPGGYGPELGYYSPAGANWAYHAMFIQYNGVEILVATRFGHVM